MSVSNGQVTIADTATQIHAPSGGASGAIVTLKHVGTNPIYLGDANVTINNGYKFEADDVLPVDLIEGDVLYGIVESDTETIHKLVTGE